MDIERINENTVKFYISYIDIEKRGFSRDEIWFNRDKSEELFWEMMDEVNDESDFEIEGPLWIQVQAMDKGLEVTVTRAQINKDGKRSDDESFDAFDKLYGDSDDGYDPIEEPYTFQSFDETMDDEEHFSHMFVFPDFEDVIRMVKNIEFPDDLETKLYSFENKYYFYIQASFEEYAEEDFTDVISVIHEYAHSSQVTIHRLQEYGNEIIAEQVPDTILRYFAS